MNTVWVVGKYYLTVVGKKEKGHQLSLFGLNTCDVWLWLGFAVVFEIMIPL